MLKSLSDLSPEEINKLRALRWKCRTDLGFLCREILGFDRVSDKNGGPYRAFHQPIIDILQHFPVPTAEQALEHDRFERGAWVYKPLRPLLELEGKRRALILDPRGHYKTTINVMSHSIQWILNYPNIAIAVFGAAEKKVCAVLSEIKQKFQFSERLRALFPEYCPHGNIMDWGTMSEFTSPARERSYARREPTMMAAALEKSASGYHFDIIKFSDIVDDTNVNENGLEHVREKFHISENLLVSPIFWIDVEGTRYHFGDTYGRIIENELYTKDEITGKQVPRPVEDREYNIHCRSVFKRVDDGESFYPNEGWNRKALQTDAKGKRIPWIPEMFPLKKLEYMEANDTYLFNCTPSWAPILMADWTEKPISRVSPGDSVIGYKISNGRQRLVKAKVLNTGHHEQEVFKLVTNKGSELYCTSDHKWFTGKNIKGTFRYKIPKIGNTLVRVYDQPEPVPEKFQRDWDWLCGILDGEGHFAKKQGQVVLYQSHEHNPEVAQKINCVLDQLSIKKTSRIRKKRKGRKAGTQWNLLGARSLKIRLLQYGNLAKRQQIIDAAWMTAGKVGKAVESKERIIQITPAGKAEVYWLETTTGNYINQGFASKNCQQMNSPASALGQVPFPTSERVPAIIKRTDYAQHVRVAYKEITTDFASTVNKRSNYTTIVTASFSAAGKVYVEDIQHGKWLPNEAIDKLLATVIKEQRYLRHVRVEDVEFTKGLIAGIQRIVDRDFIPNNLRFPLKLIKRDNQVTKTERIMKSLQPYYIRGDVVFLNDIDAETWTHFRRECDQFPNGVTDDILDALSDLFSDREWFGRELPRVGAEVTQNQVAQALNRAFDRWILAGGTTYLPQDSNPSDDFYGSMSKQDEFFNRTGQH